ncbi:hypothetical protein Desaci_0798 [Desulfosporosinus acidiphilus SJ4]|uniref:Uncharacterized protein n=1 Tax=Desulfosporosinus acidiphilus (strain DSM 22704 / JCM 16185 / SJ4) TaxID=646529 RepID=I4D234_DESAJ|nr:hypothetical protein Desaci_0798 [Desulfosporosinus acidiphilus SJ4]
MIFKALIFSVILLTYFSIPIFLIIKLAKFKSLRRIMKEIIISLIVVVFYLVSTELLKLIGDNIVHN